MAERAHPDDPGFQGTIYEARLRERYAFTLPLIAGRDVLDAPCGTGWGTSLLLGARSVAGLDIAPEALAYAREHFPGPRYVEGPLEALPFGAGEFDVVICLEGLEHLPLGDARRFLAEAWRVLRPGGLLVVTAPLLKDGLHSGNPYHLYEFDERELRELLGARFAPQDVAVVEGGDSPELRFVGRRRTAPRPEGQPTEAGLALAERARAWAMGLERASGFAFADGHAATLLGTCFAVLTLEGLGALDAAPPERRAAWAAAIGAAQRPADGLFADPLLADHPPGDDGHDEEYLLHQMTYFALQALDALGARPPHGLRFAERFEAPGELRAWLDGLDWSNAWLQSNRVMFVLAALLFRAEAEGSERALPAVHAAIDWLDEAQDADTGLWGGARGSSPLNAMAAAYHFLPFYDYLRRPIARVDAIIDATLALQQPDGLFAAGPGGGACEDLDAIDVLAVCARLSGHRGGEVRRALLRAFWAIWNAQNEDGGFGYALAPAGATYRFSGWAPMEQELRLSDSWATWFRLLALATTQRLYPNDLPPLPPWRFRRSPALGYHRFDDAVEDAAAVARLLRPLPAPSPLAGGAPVASVVIPCYNLGIYLHEALASALAQSVQPVEVIVVDDGSTDPFTRLLLAQLDHPQVRVLRQENRGLPAARNVGIGAAGAAAICCLDADDRLGPSFLERALPLLEADPQVGFVSSFYREFDGRSSELRYERCGLPEMLVTNRAMVASLFRREAWERAGGYCERLSGMHDWDLWIGMLEAGYRGEVVPEVLFEYRIRPGSMYTATRRPENYGRLIGQIVARHEALFERWHREVIAGQAVEFARLVEYASGQARLAAQLQQASAAGWAGQGYHAQQATAWQRVAEEYEAARDYHAQQAASWQRVAGEYEAARDYHAQQAASWQRVADAYEEARDYHAQQAANWQRAAEERAAEVARLEAALEERRAPWVIRTFGRRRARLRR